MPERTFSSPDYRYGFNGKEKDEEGEWGSLTHYDYGFRIYNPGIGRFLSVDPLTPSYPMFSPYQFAGNTPIMAIDVDGLETLIKKMYKIEYLPVFKAGSGTVWQRVNNAAGNTMALISNSTVIPLVNGVAGAEEFFVDFVKGEYNEITVTEIVIEKGQDVANYLSDANEYHLETPIGEQLYDFCAIVTDLETWELPVQLILFKKVGDVVVKNPNTLPTISVSAERSRRTGSAANSGLNAKGPGAAQTGFTEIGKKNANSALKKILPAWKKVSINIEHIVSGHMLGGSRNRMAGIKDVFPEYMDKAAIERAVRNAYKNVSKKLKSQDDRVLLRGQTDQGLIIEMWLNKSTKTIETAYPKYQ